MHRTPFRVVTSRPERCACPLATEGEAGPPIPPIDLDRLARLLDEARKLLAGQPLEGLETEVLQALIKDSRTPADPSLAASDEIQYRLRADAIIRHVTGKQRK